MIKTKVTLQTIADKAHVSKALVSRVLNNRPVRVSEQKRNQILELANKLDYIPSGQTLSASSIPKLNKTLALILPNLQSNFMSKIAQKVTEVAYDNGYSLIVFDSKENNALELRYLDLCYSLKVSGIILDLFSGANNKNHIEKLNQWDIPFVFIDCYPNASDVSIVSSKNKEGLFTLTESLVERGHENILSIIQNRSALTNVSTDRLNGYYTAMNKHGLNGYNEIIYPDRDFRIQPIYSLLNSSINFSAFIIHTGTDVEYFNKIISATKYSKDINYEMAVFDDFNIPFSEYFNGDNFAIYRRIVGIISQRPEVIAYEATNAILENIKKGKDFIPVRKFIDCDLIKLKI